MITDTTVYPFLDPLTDFGFKHLFGTDRNRDLLISFLNAVFKGEKKIIDVKYGATEQAGDHQVFKRVYFDIACTTDLGEYFIIEMQQEKQLHFRDRCIFYLSRSIQKQIVSGSRWREPLTAVYVIALMDFKLTDSEPGSYLQDIALMNRDSGKLFYVKLGFKFIELPCFNKIESELETDSDKWLYILKNMSKFTEIPVSFQKGVYFKFFQEAELIKMSKTERDIYDSNWKSFNDYENTIEYAELKGELKNNLFIAKKLKQLGFSTNQIFEITGLPIQEIEKLDYGLFT